MITPQEAITLLQSSISTLEAMDDASSVDVSLVLTKAALTLSKSVADSSPVVFTPQNENPDILAPLKGIMDDLGEKDPYVAKIKTFLDGAQNAKTEGELINLALASVVDSNWSFKVDINGNGREVSLVNGSEVISLGKTLLTGNPLDATTVVLGLATKFEKEVFGFSVIETAKSLDELSRSLASPNSQDAKIEGVLNTLDSLLEKMGTGRVSPYIKQVINLVNILNGEKAKANKVMENALTEFEKGKQQLIASQLPPEETTTTTQAPTTTLPPEDTYVVAPPDQAPESEKQGSTTEENELLESAGEFENFIVSDDADDEDYFG